MAINKEVQLENGIITKYHRVVSINKITNQNNIIEIASYTNQEKRQEEKEYYDNPDKEKVMNVYINTTYLSKEYSETETIKDVYDYLKTLDEYKNAQDV